MLGIPQFCMRGTRAGHLMHPNTHESPSAWPTSCDTASQIDLGSLLRLLANTKTGATCMRSMCIHRIG
mgnify:CR=1 FL=1